MGFLQDAFGVVQSGCEFTDYFELLGFIFHTGLVTTVCMMCILYLTNVLVPTQGALYLSPAAALEKLVSAIELQEDVDEALLDICVDFCTQDRKGRFEGRRGVGDQDEVYRHYLKLQPRKIDEKRREKIKSDTKGGAVAVLIDF